jgi:hypothetical protein
VSICRHMCRISILSIHVMEEFIGFLCFPVLLSTTIFHFTKTYNVLLICVFFTQVSLSLHTVFPHMYFSLFFSLNRKFLSLLLTFTLNLRTIKSKYIDIFLCILHTCLYILSTHAHKKFIL